MAIDTQENEALEARDLGGIKVDHLSPSLWNNLAKCLLSTSLQKPCEGSTASALSVEPGPEESIRKYGCGDEITRLHITAMCPH